MWLGDSDLAAVCGEARIAHAASLPLVIDVMDFLSHGWGHWLMEWHAVELILQPHSTTLHAGRRAIAWASAGNFQAPTIHDRHIYSHLTSFSVASDMLSHSTIKISSIREPLRRLSH